MLKDKVLFVSVTYNNPVLLEHIFETYKRHDPGYDCDFLIVDHFSDNPLQLKVLDKLSKKYSIVQYENNRVEVSFNKAWQNNKDYKYYFFVHDDAAANKDNWLKVFIDRLKSGYIEEIGKKSGYENLPIGRVGAMHQPWRNYSSVLGHAVQCLFLEPFLREYRKDFDIPKMFKHADPDRCLITNECLSDVNGVPNIGDFKLLETENRELFDNLCSVLDTRLPYYDEGIPPRDQYPEGKCWNKFTMVAEFLNSIDPLLRGYRTVGLEGDGFLEQIHGNDSPFGNKFIHHYGQPNVVEFLAKQFNTDSVEVKKRFSDKIMLMKYDKLIKRHFEDK